MLALAQNGFGTLAILALSTLFLFPGFAAFGSVVAALLLPLAF